MAPLGDLIKSKVRSFSSDRKFNKLFPLQNVARLAAPRLLLVLQAPSSIHFPSLKDFKKPCSHRHIAGLPYCTSCLASESPFSRLTILTDSADRQLTWRLIDTVPCFREGQIDRVMPKAVAWSCESPSCL